MTKEEFLKRRPEYIDAIRRAKEQFVKAVNELDKFDNEYIDSFGYKIGDLISIDRVAESRETNSIKKGYITNIMLSTRYSGGIDMMVVSPNKNGSKPAPRYCGGIYWNVLPQEITILNR